MGKQKKITRIKGQKNQAGGTAPLPAPGLSRTQALIIVSLAALALIAAVTAVWVKPRIESDLYIGIAGGRDVAQGLLGQPDDWSFTTAGRTWINQNWGADALFHMAEQAFGFDAFILIKALLIALTAVFTVLACRRRGGGWGAALVMASAAILFAGFFYSIRASLFTFVLIPATMLVLYESREKPLLSYLAALMTGVWANLHGGYIFGLLMMFLWAGSMILEKAMKDGVKNRGLHLHYLFSALIALLLSAFCNPFGIGNLAMSLSMAGGSAFQNITEWRPVWDYTAILNITVFFAAISVPVLLIAARHLFAGQTAVLPSAKKPNPMASFASAHADAGLVLFDALLIAACTILALKSQRIFPIALLAAAPLASSLLTWLTARFRAAWLPGALIAAVLAYSGFELTGAIPAYQADNPLFENGSLYKKMAMVYESNFPVSLAEFINDNHIGGNAFSCWTWDGYLRWLCPQVKAYIGGRAQQIYGEETLKKSLDYESGRLPVTALAGEDCHMVLGSFINRDYRRMFADFNRTPNWVVLYFDGVNYLAVDSLWGPGRELIGKAGNNRLAFRDKATENISAVCTSINLTKGINQGTLFSRMTEALRYRQESWCYEMLGKILAGNPGNTELAGYLERELERLSAKDPLHTARGVDLLESRGTVALILKEYFTRQGNGERARKLAAAADADLKAIAALYGKSGEEGSF
jgi:hypothetical protein